MFKKPTAPCATRTVRDRGRRALYLNETDNMKLQQVSENCFAVLNEKNNVCDANSGLINQGAE
jgi:hypothetical protein